MRYTMTYWSDVLAHERGSEYCPEIVAELSLYHREGDFPSTCIDSLTIDGKEADEALESRAFREELGKELQRVAEGCASDVATEHYHDFVKGET